MILYKMIFSFAIIFTIGYMLSKSIWFFLVKCPLRYTFAEKRLKTKTWAFAPYFSLIRQCEAKWKRIELKWSTF